MGRWLRKSAGPIISRHLALLALVAAAVLLFFHLFVPPVNDGGHCGLGCHSQVPGRSENIPRDLLDLIF